MRKNVCRVLAALLACTLMMTGCSSKESTEQTGPAGIAV